jgi:DNA-binding winged helix-turn-helix (wHTH) protein
MPEKIVYEFEDFQLDPENGKLMRAGNPIQIRAKPFELLLLFVENPRHSLPKDKLISLVWPRSTVTDANFHVNLDAVRKALGESGRDPRLILRTGNGYKFLADVRKTTADRPSLEMMERDSGARRLQISSSEHIAHTLVSSCLYGLYFAVAWILEIAYEFDQLGRSGLKVASVVFFGMMISAIVGLKIDRRLILTGSKWALALCVLWFVFTAAVLFAGALQVLPQIPITQSVLQTYPAQAAYLKDISYVLVLALFFLILPFHYIVTIEANKYDENTRGGGVLTSSFYPRFWALALLLIVLAGFSLIMTARLLDHLKPSPHMNLFIQLVYLRALIYFALGIECLIWYYYILEQFTGHRDTEK